MFTNLFAKVTFIYKFIIVSTDKPDKTPQYRVPALEKGLDILELLAEETEGLTQKQIAQQLNRSPDELFRVFVCLENRGYLHRMRPGDTYHLTSRLFVLAHKHPPTQRLMDAALPLMRELSRVSKQSCHLSIPSPEGLLVVTQIDAPVSLGFAVRRGTVLDRSTSSSGIVFSAFPEDEDSSPVLSKKLQQIRKAGCLKKASAAVRGITDLCSPILDHRGAALAVLCVPYVSFLTEDVPVESVLAHVMRAAQQVSETQGWHEDGKRRNPL